MKRKVYRALDRPSSFFGIRGRFIILFGAVAVGGLMLSAVIGKNTVSMVGTLCFLGTLLADYAFIRTIQSRMTERTFTRSICSRNIPKTVKVMPHSIKSNLK